MRRLRPRFLARLFASYVVLVMVGALATEHFASRAVEREQRDATAESLTVHAALLREWVSDPSMAADLHELQRRVEALGAGGAGVRVTVAATDGRVLADSAERPEAMENHADREEFVAAAAHGSGRAERESQTTGLKTLYFCLAVRGGGPVGFVRAAMPLPKLEQRLERFRGALLGGIAVGGALALAIALFMARRLTGPLNAITGAAVALAEGESAQAIVHDSADEVGDLARAFNRMSARLKARMADLVREREKLATVFESMSEGLVAVDPEEAVLH